MIPCKCLASGRKSAGGGSPMRLTTDSTPPAVCMEKDVNSLQIRNDQNAYVYLL